MPVALAQSPLRVHSQEEADIIYLPFYAALECRLSQAMEGDAHKAAYNTRVRTWFIKGAHHELQSLAHKPSVRHYNCNHVPVHWVVKREAGTINVPRHSYSVFTSPQSAPPIAYLQS